MHHKQNYEIISRTLARLALHQLYQQNHWWYNSCVEGELQIEGKVTRMVKQKLDDINDGTLARLALHCLVARPPVV